MDQSLRTIEIKGAYGFGNFGDDALMFAVYQVATRVFEPQSITFLCHDAGYIQRILPGVKIVPPDEENRPEADILLYGGGTQFYSFPLTKERTIPSFESIVRNLREPSCIGTKIHKRIRQFVPDTETTHKLAAIGIGLGPFDENSCRLSESKKLFRRMEYVAVRDIDSYRLCQEWGCRNLSLSTDLCYFPELWQTCESKNYRDTDGNLNRIGVIVRDWGHNHEGNSYTEPLFRTIDSLRREGKTVEFISFSATSDGEWIKRLKDRNEFITVWNPESESISSFLGFLSKYDLFITARYHGAVFASILRKPTVAIEIEKKLALVSDLLGDGARLWAYPFNSAHCLEHIAEFERNYSRSVKCIDGIVEGQMRLARKMVEDFEIFIRGKCLEPKST